MQTPTRPPKVHSRQPLSLEATPINPLSPPPLPSLVTPLAIIIVILVLRVGLRTGRVDPRDLQLDANQSNS